MVLVLDISFEFGLLATTGGNEMTIPCLQCDKLNTCDRSDKCKKLAEFLSVDIPMTERPASEILKEGENEDRKDVPDIDKIRKINRAGAFGDAEDQDNVWELVSTKSVSDWTTEEDKHFRKLIDKGVPYGQVKLKRRFYSFLRCEKITDIAKRANTSKQNIQQTFQRVIERIAEKWKREDKPSTPLKFKSMITGWK